MLSEIELMFVIILFFYDAKLLINFEFAKKIVIKKLNLVSNCLKKLVWEIKWRAVII